MPTTLPTLTETIDNQFLQTWYEIRPVAIDNVLLATNVWALLKLKGRFVPQVGGRYIERTIRYGVGPTPLAVSKGDTLGQGEVETETAAFWTFRNISVHIQRSLFDDVQNSGKFKIKDYVAQRIQEARDSLPQKFETDLERAVVSDESGKEIQGLNDVLPPYASATTGTYGKITRCSAFTVSSGVATPSTSATNSWWGSKYKNLNTPIQLNLLSDMRTAYNVAGNNQEFPDIILTTRTIYEIYEDFAEDKTQIVRGVDTPLANLGFDELRYKGKTLTWSANRTENTIMMLNSKYIEVVYDPNMWFSMSEWVPVANQTERLAYIFCRMNIISTQPRRHILLQTNVA